MCLQLSLLKSTSEKSRMAVSIHPSVAENQAAIAGPGVFMWEKKKIRNSKILIAHSGQHLVLHSTLESAKNLLI